MAEVDVAINIVCKLKYILLGCKYFFNMHWI